MSILIYVNELSPGNDDIENLKKGLDNGTTDELPTTAEERGRLDRWRPGNDTQNLLSQDYRWRRAVRVIPATVTSVASATQRFDQIVQDIETLISNEARDGDISRVWVPTCGDKATCDACDFYSFCPRPAGHSVNRQPIAPDAP